MSEGGRALARHRGLPQLGSLPRAGRPCPSTRSARVSARVVEYVGAQRRRYAAKARARKRGKWVPSNGAGEISQDGAALRMRVRVQAAKSPQNPSRTPLRPVPQQRKYRGIPRISPAGTHWQTPDAVHLELRRCRAPGLHSRAWAASPHTIRRRGAGTECDTASRTRRKRTSAASERSVRQSFSGLS